MKLNQLWLVSSFVIAGIVRGERVRDPKNRMKPVTPVNPVSLLLVRNDDLQSTDFLAPSKADSLSSHSSAQLPAPPADGTNMNGEEHNSSGIGDSAEDYPSTSDIFSTDQYYETKLDNTGDPFPSVENDELKPIVSSLDRQDILDIYHYFNQHYHKDYHLNDGKPYSGNPTAPTDQQDPLVMPQEDNESVNNMGTNYENQEETAYVTNYAHGPQEHNFAQQPDKPFHSTEPSAGQPQHIYVHYYPISGNHPHGSHHNHSNAFNEDEIAASNFDADNTTMKTPNATGILSCVSKPSNASGSFISTRPSLSIFTTKIGILMTLFFIATPVLMGILALSGVPDIVIISIAAVYIPVFVFTAISSRRAISNGGRRQHGSNLDESILHLINRYDDYDEDVL